ncbi:MAG: 2-oxoacid:acceptor oxidoreductase family protein [Desulfonatronovibrionaceae bacterium]
MYKDTIIAGFGGQGVIMIGNLLAYAAMGQGLHVTYIPVYGPEMRGGTANCTVVISDEEIGSPIIHNPESLIAMNRPSLDKFQSRVKEGGQVVINSSLVDAALAETNRLMCFAVPANDIANRIGNTRMANMVALGGFLEATGCVDLSTAQNSLENVIPAHYSHLIPKNSEALAAGSEHVRQNGRI